MVHVLLNDRCDLAEEMVHLLNGRGDLRILAGLPGGWGMEWRSMPPANAAILYVTESASKSSRIPMAGIRIGSDGSYVGVDAFWYGPKMQKSVPSSKTRCRLYQNCSMRRLFRLAVLERAEYIERMSKASILDYIEIKGV